MNISLTPELEKLVAERVASGHYASASEVVREALRLLHERDRLSHLRHDIGLGLEQLDSGRSGVFDKVAANRIKSEGRKRLGASREKSRAR
jgi:antitoxin ParD1/3/4